MKAQEINQNRVLAFLFFIGLAFFYKIQVWDPYFYGPPDLPQQDAQQQAPGLPQATSPQPTSSKEDAREHTTTVNAASEQALKQAGSLTAHTDYLTAEVSLLGGRLKKLDLARFKDSIAKDSPPLDLIENGPALPYPLGVYSGGVNDSSILYRVKGTSGGQLSGQSFVLSEEKGGFVLEGQLPDGRAIEKNFTFIKGGYLMEIAIKLSAPAEDASKLQLEFTKFVEEESSLFSDRTSGFAWFDGSSTGREVYSGTELAGELVPQAVWAGFSDKYFAEVMISKQTPVPVIVGGEQPNYFLRATGGDVSASFMLYLGPKSYNYLKSVGYDLHRTVDLGWASVIAVPLLDLLEFFHKLLGNWGLAIIALTIVVKTALYPLTASSHKQMKAMQDLGPEMKRIQEQTKDRGEQQMQMMALYKKHNVNPVGGCFPMLLQLPVFIGLYYGLLSSMELRHAHFAFWISDLSAPEELMIFGAPIPLMVILMVLTMLVVQWTTPTTATVAQKRMMLIIPIVFGFFFATFPAGLTLYFLVNNLISIGQTKGLQSSGKYHPLVVTAVVSTAILLFAWILVAVGGR